MPSSIIDRALPKVPRSDVADRAIGQKQSIGRSRILPIKLKVIEDLKKEKIHVFNVGPWAQTINTGSTGTFTIPACPNGDEYVEMLVMNARTGEMEPPISIIMEEFVIKSEDEMTSLTEDGWNFAQSMLQANKGKYRTLLRFGIFASRNEVPTREELRNAHLALEEECRENVKWAGDMHVIDRSLFARVMRVAGDKFRDSACILGRDNPQDSPWMLDAEPAGRTKCKMCGRLCDPDVATCEAGHVVNMELYLELQAADEQLKAAIAAKPKVK
jgi:hypothetical protein